jgi:hypothetical protein
VLPGAVLHSEYAGGALDYVTRAFGEVTLLRIPERLFADAEEESIILLAAGRGDEPGALGARDVEAAVTLGDPGDRSGLAAVADIKMGSIPSAARRAFERAIALEDVVDLGAVARVRLGVVTGANAFFVRAARDIHKVDGIQSHPVVARSAWLAHPTWTSKDQRTKRLCGGRTELLVVRPAWRRRGQFARELDEAETAALDKRSHCRRRKKWWVLEDFHVPDAFLPYMGAVARGLVLNRARATSTNAIHRVDFTEGAEQTAVIGSSWTTLASLATELCGRHYGGGVLKLELSAAQGLPVVPDGISTKIVEASDQLFRAGKSSAARDLLDREVLIRRLGLSAGEVGALAEGTAVLKDRRLLRSNGEAGAAAASGPSCSLC